MRRLYSTFAGGWPGVGLILMRLVTGVALASSAGTVLLDDPPALMAIVSSLLGCAAILLVVGLCTPIAGTAVALIESCNALLIPSDRLLYLLIATFGVALALLGPGLWSIDARLFGWKRIQPTTRRS